MPSELPHLPVASPQQEHIRGILRSPSQTSGTSYASIPQQHRRPSRPRGWSLRRQLWSKQDAPEPHKLTPDIGLSTLPVNRVLAPAEPRASRSIDDVDAIRVVHTALDQARLHPRLQQSNRNPQQSRKSLPSNRKSLKSHCHFIQHGQGHIVPDTCYGKDAKK